jgi:F-type H+-transporting ATPase subunit epsilon
MYLEIVSPEATLFTGEITSVTVPGINGEFQMLANHAPIVSLLQKGEIKIQGNAIKITEANEANFSKITATASNLYISGGTVEMKDNKIIVLAD